jgi:hypothetical protein
MRDYKPILRRITRQAYLKVPVFQVPFTKDDFEKPFSDVERAELFAQNRYANFNTHKNFPKLQVINPDYFKKKQIPIFYGEYIRSNDQIKLLDINFLDGLCIRFHEYTEREVRFTLEEVEKTLKIPLSQTEYPIDAYNLDKELHSIACWAQAIVAESCEMQGDFDDSLREANQRLLKVATNVKFPFVTDYVSQPKRINEIITDYNLS